MSGVAGKRARVLTGGLLGVAMLLGSTACGSSSDNTLGQKADVVITKVDGLPRFDPNKLEIKRNQEITVSVLNKDKILHNITVPAFSVDTDIQPGQRVEVKFPAVGQAPRDGFFTFYDKYHQADGQAGRITVSK